ncbi:PRC-barrel domain-containing protein [Minwuia sp.]|uniref:PRC-barrel domain-containing protein n=1 Tax=Minwuia sp. TaxID=2493630 RepID=UPI003A9465F7
MAGFGAANGASTTNQAKTDDEKVEAVSECREAIRDLESDYAKDDTRLPADLRRDERSLREAAMTFARNGNEDACEMVISEIRNMRENYAEKQEEIEERRAERERLVADSISLGREGRLVWMDGLIGDEVVNTRGEELGNVEDVAVSNGADKQVYVMISHGGFLGIGEDMIPIRLSDLRQTKDGDTLVLNVGADTFAEAPEVEFDDEARATASGWASDMEAWWKRNISN